MMEVAEKEAQLEAYTQDSGASDKERRSEFDDRELRFVETMTEVENENATVRPATEAKDYQLPAPALQVDIRNLKILVLDENQISRDVLQDLLTSWGLRNDAVSNLPELMGELKGAAHTGDPYHVAVVSLSEVEVGILTENIKQNPAISCTKLILLQSIKEQECFRLEREAEFEACLVKPFRASQLMDVLNGIVQSKNQMPELAAPRIRPQRFTARVLVVEDNSVNQKLAKYNLERLGCSVNLAGNGKEAVEILKLVPYDIVFMDCEMPVLDGFEATQQIRKLYPEKKIPIIAMTARALKGDREKCLLAGMDAYISKPVELADFESALQQWASQTVNHNSGIPSITSVDSNLIDYHVSRKLQDLAQIMEPHELASLIEEFLASCKQYISGMKQASSQSRPDYLRMHAHSLKGSSLYMGANRIADLCMKLEKLGMNKEMEASKELITQIEEEFSRLKDHLQHEKDSILRVSAV